jgi:hydrogenase expression/formation protein HypE
MAMQKDALIKLSHGAGGSAMHELIKEVILQHLRVTPARSTDIEVALEDLDDASAIDGMAFTTDSHTVKPLFFPGGDIGSLAVAGTINDLAVIGAEPLALASSFVIEEGFKISDLNKVLVSMRETCELAGVPIITGDTKVVERGALDQLIINTAAIGRRAPVLEHNMREVTRYRKLRNDRWIVDSNLEAGDKIILSGTVGDHGIALLAFREGYGFDTQINSDIYPLNKLIRALLEVGGIVAMKDPTRGGLANTLNEFSEKSRAGIIVYEEDIPVRSGVRSACEMLGIDPLEIGNEGKVVLGVVRDKADEILETLKRREEGKDAAIIGDVRADIKGVVLQTEVGGRRILEQPIGDPVPRIC